jgi:DNA-binding response OmpR family regulator
VKVVLLRLVTRFVESPTIEAGPVAIDAARRVAAVDGAEVGFTSMEFKLLQTLVQRPGRVQSREGRLPGKTGLIHHFLPQL